MNCQINQIDANADWCDAPSVLRIAGVAYCEKHAPPEVLELVRAVEDEMAVWERKSEKRLRIRRAIVAVKKGK